MTTQLNHRKIDERAQPVQLVYDWCFEIAEVLTFQIYIGQVPVFLQYMLLILTLD